MSRSEVEPRGAQFRWLGGPWPAVVLGLLCFANSLSNGFTYDDNSIVRTNPRIRSLTNFREIWLTDWWYEQSADEPIPDPSRDRLYRPLTLFSFALNYAVHGVRPFGYHLVNVLLHAGVCWLVWRFAYRLFHDPASAFIAALLFAVHPVHSEAVAGVVGRGEILASGFLLLGLLALLPRAEPARTRCAALAAGAFFAALLSKETAVCYPLVALVVLHAANRDRRLRPRWWLQQVAWLLLPLVVYLPLRYAALEERLIRDRLTSILFNPLHDADLAGRLHGPLTILGHYVRLLVVPRELSCDYGLAVFNPHAGPELMTLLGGLSVAGLIVALFGYRRASPTWRRMAVLAAMFLASYALISNTGLLIGISLAERLMYWPSVPLLLAAAVGVVAFWRRCCAPGRPLQQRAALFRILGILLLLALGLRSVVRNSDWASDEQLFSTDLKTFPRSAHMNNSLARIILYHANQATQAGDIAARDALLKEAEQLLERALRVQSRFPDALKNLGLVYLLRDDPEQAIRYLNSAVWLNPADHKARRVLARLRDEVQPNEGRAQQLRRAIEQHPDNPALRLELAEVLITLGRHYEALRECEQARRLAPANVAALRAYGQALVLNLQDDAALKVFEQVLAREPDDWQTHANISKLLSERDPARALRHAQIAFDLQPDDLRTQINLAEALALNGRLAEAVSRLRAIAASLPADDPFHRAVIDRIDELEDRRR
jgi:Flp pilus assembly protein TadD